MGVGWEGGRVRGIKIRKEAVKSGWISSEGT